MINWIPSWFCPVYIIVSYETIILIMSIFKPYRPNQNYLYVLLMFYRTHLRKYYQNIITVNIVQFKCYLYSKWQVNIPISKAANEKENQGTHSWYRWFVGVNKSEGSSQSSVIVFLWRLGGIWCSLMCALLPPWSSANQR